MENDLTGKRVAILAADGFEEDELVKPRDALEEAGAETEAVSLEEGKIKRKKHMMAGRSVAVNVPIAEANADDNDALLPPGACKSPDASSTFVVGDQP